jgi:hypothetical protein
MFFSLGEKKNTSQLNLHDKVKNINILILFAFMRLP